MKKFTRGFGYAFKGLWYAAKTQLNFRVHLICTIIALVLGYILDISVTEWLWIFICIGLVLLTELLNTALELLCDVISPEYNEKIGHVKDISAGAVLVTAITSLVIGAVIFLPKLLLLIHHAA
ncbi:diacylglycerol kinase family protein [Mucilaginibacter ginsenosidivorans]|uniref:Diacylglycerol kinase family protein n=1 Tax=Mucilaginibacter ginsenosidivorans TaxID=398053 RepID=A0A5B8UTG2_9SPHI|nr:diacylglycerol kinase family protein [Mucilaginibacter ginsenosidivorans]QEC62182.1 diacylglycerol kinase family protein [Mucilaginibacter ginsenosidivorans]